MFETFKKNHKFVDETDLNHPRIFNKKENCSVCGISIKYLGNDFFVFKGEVLKQELLSCEEYCIQDILE